MTYEDALPVEMARRCGVPVQFRYPKDGGRWMDLRQDFAYVLLAANLEAYEFRIKPTAEA